MTTRISGLEDLGPPRHHAAGLHALRQALLSAPHHPVVRWSARTRSTASQMAVGVILGFLAGALVPVMATLVIWGCC